MTLKIQETKKRDVPEWIVDGVALLAPRIDATTQFVCKTHDPNFGKSPRDEDLVVEFNNSKSVKTTELDTDGEIKRAVPINWADGYVEKCFVTNWTWLLVENVVRGTGDNELKVVKTLYVRDKHFLLELRRAVGLNGW